MRKTRVLKSLVMAGVCLCSLLLTGCATMVTEEMLTPDPVKSVVSLPRLYPIMLERQDFRNEFNPMKQSVKLSADVFYNDMRKMFRENMEKNYRMSNTGDFGYIRCNNIDVKFKSNAWYLVPSICTLFYANLMGCPFLGSKSINEASFSVLDCEGQEIKRYSISGVGTSSGGIYTLGRDIWRFAYIKASKDLLSELNEAIQKDSYWLSSQLRQSWEQIQQRKQLGEKDVNSGDKNYTSGVDLLLKGNNAKALEQFNIAINNHPHHYWAMFYRGVVSYNMGRYSMALKDFNAALRIYPSLTDALYYLAMVKQKQRCPEEALAYISRAVILEPNEHYCTLYGSLLMQEGYLEEAKTQYKKILKINPDRIEMYDKLAKLDELIEAQKTMEQQQYMELLMQQSATMQQAFSQPGVQTAGSSVTNTESGMTTAHRSRESVQRDLDDAKRLLADMEKNSSRDDSGVDQVIYSRMIQRQREKISKLEQELREIK